jgi:hypothetical protein
MIPWWWVVELFVLSWAFLVTVAVICFRDLRAEVLPGVLAVVCFPLILLTAVVTRLDIGAIPLDARAVARFAEMRSADKRPAWMFFAWKRGVLIVRKWEVGSDRVKVNVRREPGQ